MISMASRGNRRRKKEWPGTSPAYIWKCSVELSRYVQLCCCCTDKRPLRKVTGSGDVPRLPKLGIGFWGDLRRTKSRRAHQSGFEARYSRLSPTWSGESGTDGLARHGQAQSIVDAGRRGGTTATAETRRHARGCALLPGLFFFPFPGSEPLLVGKSSPAAGILSPAGSGYPRGE